MEIAGKRKRGSSTALLGCFGCAICFSLILFILIAGGKHQHEIDSITLKQQTENLRESLRVELKDKQNLELQISETKQNLVIKEQEILANQLEFQKSAENLEVIGKQVLQIETKISNLVVQAKSIKPTPSPIPVSPSPIPVSPSSSPQPKEEPSPSPIPISPSPIPVPPKVEEQEQKLETGNGDSDSEVESRRDQIKEAFQHAWGSYKKYAWGKDELRPLSKGFVNWLDLGVTIVDSLDTLWIMGFKEDFYEARDWVRDHLTFHKDRGVSFFETVIRELGGLLSAYEFSRDPVFLEKAEDIGQRLLKAFGSDVMPAPSINLATGNNKIPTWTGGRSILSEVGTIQLEFLYLAYHTGKPEYAEQALKVFDILDKLQKPFPGLYPLYLTRDGHFSGNEISVGGLGDSFYEYELKLWLMTNKRADGYRRMYEESAHGIAKELVRTSKSGYRYIGNMVSNHLQEKMEHLTCFAGGMFALGGVTNATNSPKEDLLLGGDVTSTCHQSYARSNWRLGPEAFAMDSNNEFSPSGRASYYILRPEVVESYFVLWRSTKDPKYRTWAWEAFTAINRFCRTEAGFAGLRGVNSDTLELDDTQQSFFLAETLKYLYLTFSDDSVVPLDKYVFNTEAHPLGIISEPLHLWPNNLEKFLMME